MNIFNPDDYYFVIDSHDLTSVESRLYGYCINENGIFDRDNYQAGMIGSGETGAYVLVEREGNTITLKQDYNGSYGLFLFEKDDWFVLGNSLFYLADYLKRKTELTVDMDYARYFMAGSIATYTVSETLINEIRQIRKEMTVVIDMNNKSLSYVSMDEKTETIPLDSEEGMEALDKWFSKWTSIIRNLWNKTKKISTALSGGFDSRMSFMLTLKSGILPEGAHVNSVNDHLRNHDEDFEIATEIAGDYGIQLNKGELYQCRSLNTSLDDALNMSFYPKLSFHKQLRITRVRFVDKRYLIGGYGGGVNRDYWHFTNEEFLDSERRRMNQYKGEVRNQVAGSISNVLSKSFKELDEKYGKDSSMFFYRDTRGRSHFGRHDTENYNTNLYQLCPLIDPDLSRVQLNTENCSDRNLLYAVIMTRYERKLLDYPFEGGRSLEPETLREAERLSDKYPVRTELKVNDDFAVASIDHRLEQLENVNPSLTSEKVSDYLFRLFHSEPFQRLFTDEFNRQFLDRAEKHLNEVRFHPYQEYYGILGVAKALQTCRESRLWQADTVKKEVDLLNGKQVETSIYEQYADYFTARVDIKCAETDDRSIQILDTDDPEALISQPAWLKKEGSGHVITSLKGKIRIRFVTEFEGTLKICLRSIDKKDSAGNRIPFWIRYGEMVLDGEEISDFPREVWHDKPFILQRKVMKDEEHLVELSWGPMFRQ